MNYTNDDAKQLEFIMKYVANTLWAWKVVFQEANMKVSEKTMEKWFSGEKTPTPKQLCYVLYKTASTKVSETKEFQSFANKYLPPLIIIILLRAS